MTYEYRMKGWHTFVCCILITVCVTIVALALIAYAYDIQKTNTEDKQERKMKMIKQCDFDQELSLRLSCLDKVNRVEK